MYLYFSFLLFGPFDFPSNMFTFVCVNVFYGIIHIERKKNHWLSFAVFLHTFIWICWRSYSLKLIHSLSYERKKNHHILPEDNFFVLYNFLIHFFHMLALYGIGIFFSQTHTRIFFLVDTYSCVCMFVNSQSFG